MHEHFDAHKAYAHIEALCAMMRMVGTPGEAEAQDYIRRAGKEAGLEFADEEFAYTERPLKVVLPVMCTVIAAISLAGSLLYLAGSALVVIPGALLLVAVFLGFRWSGTFERFASRGDKRSVNLVARIPGRQPSGTIMLSAHYDAKSQLMPVAVRAGTFMLGFLTAILFGITLLVVGIISTSAHDYLGSTAGFYLSLIPAVLVFSLVFNVTGNRSAGALDDAAGVAIIVEAGRVLAAAPLENYDVVIAAFGCEEVGLCGSISYLLAHEAALKERPFYMLNFDMPFTGAGNLVLNTGFELPPVLTSRTLNGLIRAEGKRMGVKVRSAYLPVGAGADHMPWVKHGFEATALVSATGYVHSAKDDTSRINREGLRRAGEVSLAALRALDQGTASPSRDPGSPAVSPGGAGTAGPGA